MEKRTITIGMKFVDLPAHNRKGQPSQVVEVVHVGRKYFTTAPIGKRGRWCEVEYQISDLAQKTEYAPDHILIAHECTDYAVVA